MSMGRVMVTPMPTAEPFMAAMTGLVHSKMRSVTRPPASRGTVSSLRPDCLSASKVSPPLPRSAPAQKARPRPVTMTARTSSSPSTRSKASTSSRIMVVVNAFIRSGRSRVIVATRSSTS